MHQCIHTARTHPIARSPKADYLAGMVALSELVYESETISDIIFKEGLMDIIRESSLIQYFKQEGYEKLNAWFEICRITSQSNQQKPIGVVRI